MSGGAQPVEETRRDMIRHFLRSRRAALTPEIVGLPVYGRRGTPGLRREEVALLAGVSVSWYTWLEQGRDIKVSAQVLEAVSAALRLDDVERAHLYRLTGNSPPSAPADGAPERLVERLDEIVDGWLPTPAFVTDRYWNVLVVNEAAVSVLDIPEPGRNHLFAFFLDPGARERYVRWTDAARHLGARFRAESARWPDDREFDRMVGELALASPLFDRMQREHDVGAQAAAVVEIRFPDGRAVSCEHTTLLLAGNPDLRLNLLIPFEQPPEPD